MRGLATNTRRTRHGRSVLFLASGRRYLPANRRMRLTKPRRRFVEGRARWYAVSQVMRETLARHAKSL
jgi:hypothetical protein